MKRRSDFSHEMLVRRHLNGIKLEKPVPADSGFEALQATTLGDLLAMPYGVFFKDTENQIQELNEAGLLSSGLISRGDALHSLFYRACQNREQISIAIGNNQYVVNSENFLVVDEHAEFVHGQSTHAISFKFPWYGENDEVLGLFGCSINFKSNDIADIAKQLTMISEQFFGSSSAPEKLVSLRQFQDVYFTSREVEVIKLIMRGKTMREIGLQLGLSRRTIESYFQNIKLKANVKTRSQLFDKMMGAPVSK